MKGFQCQVLSFKDDLKQVIGIYEEERKGNKYCLYLRELNESGVWSGKRIMGVFSDFYRLLYAAGELCRMQCMFETDK